MSDGSTTIRVTKETRDRLKAYGRKGEPYDAILNRMMDVWDAEGE